MFADVKVDTGKIVGSGANILRPSPLARAEAYRFFIELQQPTSPATDRRAALAYRQRHAAEFTQQVQHWLLEQDLARDVYSLTVTALGQIQIVCSAAVIAAIRQQDTMPIAQIRSARDISDKLGALTESLGSAE